MKLFGFQYLQSFSASHFVAALVYHFFAKKNIFYAIAHTAKWNFATHLWICNRYQNVACHWTNVYIAAQRGNHAFVLEESCQAQANCTALEVFTWWGLCFSRWFLVCQVTWTSNNPAIEKALYPFWNVLWREKKKKDEPLRSHSSYQKFIHSVGDFRVLRHWKIITVPTIYQESILDGMKKNILIFLQGRRWRCWYSHEAP